MRNLEGNTIAFGGRILKKDDKAPKYLNSPQTPIYDKSRIVYNLEQAKIEVRKKNQLILVEGYMDVIAAWQNGNQNVAATSGTALTPAQLTIIKRYTPNILLAFDSDLAGSEATKRGIETAIEKGLNVKIINLGKFKDPDEMIKEEPKQWQKAIKKAVPIMDFYFENAFQKVEKITPQTQKQISIEILPLIAKLKSPIDQDHYLKKLSDKLNLESKILHAEMENLLREQAKSGNIQSSLGSAPKLNKNRVQITLEEYLIAIILLDPKLQSVILKELKTSDFTEDFSKKLYSLIQEKGEKKVQINLEDVEKKLERSEKIKLNLLLIKVEEENKKLTDPLEKKEIKIQIQNLKSHTLIKKLRELQTKLKEAEGKNNPDIVKELTKKITELTQKLSKSQEEK
ncbi:toprim domain-containing protein [Patescibacteria group bacterium]